jgi:hypothetical protein
LDVGGGFEGPLMERERDAGGPTGTMREPNSTPIVTSWWGEKRPSHRRTVSYVGLVGRCEGLGRRVRTLDLPQPESPSDTIFAM